MDAGRFDAATAYAAVNTMRLDDFQPHIYRTHDGGKTWTQITNGIADGAIINVVREDPKRKGLLFAGSETQVWVSFDDGDHWSSLRLNMPATSIRDLIVKDDDIAVGTHGRSFWILDDIAPLRQITRSHGVRAGHAVQARGRLPLPLEQVSRHADSARRAVGAESARRRDHRLLPRRRHARRREARDRRAERPRDPRVLEPRHVDGAGGHRQHAGYWIRPTQVLSRRAGLPSVRVGSALRAAGRHELAARAAIRSRRRRATRRASRAVRGPRRGSTRCVSPSAASRIRQPLTIKMDPRVKTPAAALAQTHAMAVRLFDAIARDSAVADRARVAARPAARDTRSCRRQCRADRRDQRVRSTDRRGRRAGRRRWPARRRWRPRSRRRAWAADVCVDQRRADATAQSARGRRRRADDAGGGGGAKGRAATMLRSSRAGRH